MLKHVAQIPEDRRGAALTTGPVAEILVPVGCQTNPDAVYVITQHISPLQVHTSGIVPVRVAVDAISDALGVVFLVAVDAALWMSSAVPASFRAPRAGSRSCLGS